MAKILYGIIAVVASLVLAESLTCNKCSFSLAGLCLVPSSVDCATNTSVCYTGKAAFPVLPSFTGFVTRGCRESTGCDMTSNGTLLGATYQVTLTCCSTDRCNNGAATTKMTLGVVMGAAVVASMWSSML
ncbi:sperm acrosome membrane-associated protein 4-like [Thalassophryne amazonica]|uniref:sperm acrosome membrane-associated protein 4-like n=1 Tax=Thalassophryne amazonica TaxID=390379 RepID=UPI001471F4ED|nr:sperm acrosome membrane-associated protein 4-like [Thalassophryne amazonica]